ncbi:MAG: DEAD/DEAH box helicase family protein [archaeon]|nr:DEAD/DEAH box helicase family protein [archaeon]
MDFSNYFPYSSYRKEQKEVITEIFQSIQKRKNILFLAPNGTGKTIDNLAAVLPIASENNLKIIYLCRTHTQNARVIEEIKKINKNFENKKTELKEISGVSIRGRAEMCLNRTVKKIKGSPTDMMNICADLRKNRNCSYFNKMIQFKTQMNADQKEISKRSTDAQELIQFCKNRKYCPYFFTKLLLKSVNVIVCNYQWVFNPDIREAFFEGAEIELENSVLIMDECHNLPDLCADIDSERLTQYSIRQALKDLEYGRANDSMIMPIRKWKEIFDSLQKKIKKQDELPLEPRGVLNHFLKLTGLETTIKLKNYINDLSDYGIAINDEKLSSGANAIDFISVVVRFMYKLLEIIDDNRYFLVAVPNRSRRNEQTLNIEILCMDPREIASYIYEKSYATISCSGTIHPDSFITLLGMNETGKDLNLIEIKSPFPKNHVKVLISENLNTKGANRTDSMYGKLCVKISEVIFNTPANIGIFCASYVVLKGLIDNNISEIVKFSGKNFYVESSKNSASDNATLIENYKSDSSGRGAVLLGVCGGRNSEGEDFPGAFMNAVIIVGFPFHRTTPRTEAKIQYYNKIFNGRGRLFAYIIPAIQRSNQACGRPIRKLDDKGAIILLDNRFNFKNYKKLLSIWIKNNAKTALNKNNFLADELKVFFKN